MNQQTHLPGTDRVIATYECGYDRTHQIPSDAVFVLKTGGAGFTAVCRCGLPADATADSVTAKPQRLGPHWTLLGGDSLGPALWLALEDAADAWDCADAPTLGTTGGGLPYGERREQYRAEMRARADSDGEVA